MKNTTYSIYLGLNDRDSKKQEISTGTALELVNKYTIKYFGAGTVSQADGIYQHEDGQIVIEKTIKIELITSVSISEFVETLKKVFNQESILVKKSIENVDFL